MAGEYYLTERHHAVLCLDPTDLHVALVAGGAPAAAFTLVAAMTAEEPYSVLSADAGFSEEDVLPETVYVECQEFQADYALNEIPQAAARVPLGRDLGQLAVGNYGVTSVSIGEVLGRYLGRSRVKCRVYAVLRQGANLGIQTSDDADPNPYLENLVLFDGYLTAVMIEGVWLRVSLTGFLSDLAASSSVTAQVSANSTGLLRFNSALSPYLQTPVQAQFNAGAAAQSLYGAAHVAIASGYALETDFWGWWYPPQTNPSPELYGIQHYLFALARQDLFNWATFQSTTLGAAACPPPTAGVKTNDLALPALKRIEPLSTPTATVPNQIRNAWDGFRTEILAALAAQQPVTAFDVAPGVARDIFAAGPNYAAVGYRYGIPIAFRRSDIGYRAFAPSYGFADDLVKETLDSINTVSMWDRLIGQYFPKYGLVLAPMTTRAVVIPLTPSLRRVWKTIHAPDSFDFRSAIDLPVQVRGVVLIGRRESPTGVQGVNPGDTRSLANDQLLAAYDSCEDGVFEFREAPAWLAGASVLPPAIGAINLTQLIRPAANSRYTTKVARNGLASLLISTPAVLDEFAGAAAIGGPAAALAAALENVLTPPKMKFGMMMAYAKALYAYERLRYRKADVLCRFRTDIGPGSTVAVEVPEDKFASGALGQEGNRYVYGVVQRVTIFMETGESPKSGTAFKLGFIRRESEFTPESDISTDGHPVWGTTVLGIPLVDSLWVRTKLGNEASLG